MLEWLGFSSITPAIMFYENNSSQGAAKFLEKTIATISALEQDSMLTPRKNRGKPITICTLTSRKNFQL